MTKPFYYQLNEAVEKRLIPDPKDKFMNGLTWGEAHEFFTPCYWLTQYWMNGFDKMSESKYKSNATLTEELTFCLLGGFGVTAELATAAFERCKEVGLIDNYETDPRCWEDYLSHPLKLEGKSRRYRYPRQKSKYLSSAMKILKSCNWNHLKGKQLRDRLLTLKGVGPKTASWIVRNLEDSDEVAILDIHLIRAGVITGIFKSEHNVDKHYTEMESIFIEFCRKLGAQPSRLDCLIWDQMREIGPLGLRLFKRAMNKPKNWTELTSLSVEEKQLQLV